MMEKRIRTSIVNIPWLTALPDRWGIARSKTLFSPRKELARPGDEQLSATQAYGVIPQKEFERREGRRVVQITQHLDKRRHVEQDDFVISMRSFQGGLERAWATGCIRSSYVVLKPSPDVHVGYFAHLFKSHDYIRALQATSNFIRDGQDLNFENFCLVDLPVVPIQEQKAIAKFLDFTDRRVRRYIRAKRRLIDLLNEQKKAIIHRAVTRGLDPNIRLKPSGVEWLGEVPEHWQSVRLKHVARVQTGLTLGKNYGPVVLEQRPYLRVANVQTSRLDLTTVKTVVVPAAEARGTELQVGDVLMTEGGDIDKLGRGCVWHGEIDGCLHQNHIFAVRPDQTRLLPEYLVAVMASQQGRIYFEITAKKTTNLASTNSSTLGAFPLALPDTREQEAVLDAVRVQTQSLDAAILEAEREVVLLREYRTRLVADAITGKMDVREAAACFPDEQDETESGGETDVFAGEDGDVAADAEPEEADA